MRAARADQVVLWWWCVLTLLLNHTTAAPQPQQGRISDSQRKVMEISKPGVVRLCVEALDNAVRLKVRHFNPGSGEKTEVLVKREWLSKVMNVLDIEVHSGYRDEPSVSVKVNDKPLQASVVQSSRSDITAPRTILFLKGKAKITNCTEIVGEDTKAVDSFDDVTGVKRIRKAEEGKQEVMANSSPAPSLPSAPVPFLPSTNVLNATADTEEPESPEEEEPWWGFLLVLGKVGEVPVLVLLLVGVLAGAAVGCVCVCLFAKVCRKRRVEYTPVAALRTRSNALHADIVRNGSDFWGSVKSSRAARNSDFDSAVGTLPNSINFTNSAERLQPSGLNSNSSTANSRKHSIKPMGSANSSIDRSVRNPMNLSLTSMNNLGKGSSRSADNSMERNYTTTTAPNIPSANLVPSNLPGAGVVRSSSNRSTASSSINRNINRSPSSRHGDSVTRSSSNRSTGSNTINRNTNRSPNIPYHNKVGAILDRSFTQQHIPYPSKPVNTYNDEDSDDSNYEKPFISRPIVEDEYSIPHTSTIQSVLVQPRTTTTTTTTTTTRDASQPVVAFGTFNK